MSIIEEHIKSVAQNGIPVIARLKNSDNRWLLKAPNGYQGTIYSSGYVYEHRLIMEYFLGKLLTKDEIVHHKDEDKLNNKLENLVLMSRAAHTALHDKEPIIVPLICDYCGVAFDRRKNDTYKGYSHNFCSLSHSVKFQMKEKRRTEAINHGTQSGYRHGCRCGLCKTFHNNRLKEYRRSKVNSKSIVV